MAWILSSFPQGSKEYLWVCDHGDSREYLGLSSWGRQGVSGFVILGTPRSIWVCNIGHGGKETTGFSE